MKLAEDLHTIEIPDADEARARARRVVLAATPPPAKRRFPIRLAITATVALTLGAAVLTPTGDAVGSWVKRLVTNEPEAPKPALTHLPGGGRLLVTSPGGAWVVDANGSRRRLGPYEDATWSPHGLFIAVTKGGQLLAVEPRGTVRWAISRPQRVEAPRWSSEGFRIAYRSAGTMRIVAGDGTGDRLLTKHVAPVAAAWRPGPEHHVTLVRSDGAIETWSADTHKRLWRGPRGPLPLAMRWTANRLSVVQPDRIISLDARGRTRRTGPLTESANAAAISADGRIALATATGVDALGRSFPVPADELTWASDGKRVLAASGDTWRFLPSDSTSADIAREFDPRHKTARGTPIVRGWAP